MTAPNPLCACCGLRLIKADPICTFCFTIATYPGATYEIIPLIRDWAAQMATHETVCRIQIHHRTYDGWRDLIRANYMRAFQFYLLHKEPLTASHRRWISCSWCNHLNPDDARFCTECGHRADKPRMECDCSRCITPRLIAHPMTLDELHQALEQRERFSDRH